MPKNIDFSEEYEKLAQDWAEHLDKPFDVYGKNFELCINLIEALWSVYPEVIEYIEADPPAFSQKVAEYRRNMHEKSFEE